MLGKWTVALGERSKYAGEFGNVKKVATLLTNNGFTLPKPKAEDVEAIIPSNLDLQTREEVRREERIYYEAKLEDHLAKGTPADLKAANELMKVLAGYDPEEYSKADGIVEEGLDRLAERIELLEQLLGNTDSSKWETDETIQTVYGECKDLMPKLLRLADSDLDSNTMTRLLGLNEELRRVVALREEPNGLDLLQLDGTPADTSNDAVRFGSMSTDALDLYSQQPIVADKVIAKYWLAEDLLIDWIQVGQVSMVRVTNLGPDLVQQVGINDHQIPILLSKETTVIPSGFVDLHTVQIGSRNLSFTQLSQ